MSDLLNTGRVIIGAGGNPFAPIQVTGSRTSRTSLSLFSTGYLLLAGDSLDVTTSPYLLPPYRETTLVSYTGSLYAQIPGPAFQGTPIVNPLGGYAIGAFPVWIFFEEIFSDGLDAFVSLASITTTGPGLAFILPQPSTQFAVQLTTTGAPTFQVHLEASQDQANWFEIGGKNLNTAGLFGLSDGPTLNVRLNCLSFSGGTSPTLTGSILASP